MRYPDTGRQVIHDADIRDLASLEEIRIQARRDRASVERLLIRVDTLEADREFLMRKAGEQAARIEALEEIAEHAAGCVDVAAIKLVCERLRCCNGYREGGDLWVGPALGEILAALGLSRDEISEFYNRPAGVFTPEKES